MPKKNKLGGILFSYKKIAGRRFDYRSGSIKMKKLLFVVTLLFGFVTVLSGCDKPELDGSYDFIIYESDSDNSNLSDNKVVARYTIEYTDCQTVSDSLIEKDGRYYFSDDSNDYLVLVDSAYGLSYTQGYFSKYAECANGPIDVSWSYVAVNGSSALTGIGETPLEGLEEYGFVINGWK